MTAEPAPQVAQKQEVVAPKPEPPKPATPYSAEITPLSTSECGRCHLGIYNTLKNEGGKHKFDCTKCHTTYHGYNPIKQNWNAIMPKCQTCHGLIHGDKFATCCDVSHKSARSENTDGDESGVCKALRRLSHQGEPGASTEPEQTYPGGMCRCVITTSTDIFLPAWNAISRIAQGRL